MKTFKILLTLIAVPMIMSSALSQEAGSSNTLRCVTTDGTILVQGNSVQVRDYDMKVESIEREGVIRLADTRSNATAVLDTRDPDGLYLAITEGDVQMQVVAHKENMEFSGEITSLQTSDKDADIVERLHSAYWTDASSITAVAR